MQTKHAGGGAMVNRWLAVEHYRMHLVENWPDSDEKTATLNSIRATMASLGGEWDCSECRAAHRKS